MLPTPGSRHLVAAIWGSAAPNCAAGAPSGASVIVLGPVQCVPGNVGAVSLDRVALGTIAMSLDELVRRLEIETDKAGQNDEMAIALLDIERQLQSCVRRFNATLHKR